VADKTLRRGRSFPRLGECAVLFALCLPTGTSGLANAAVESGLGARASHRMSGRLPGKPAYLWLWYADGKAAPVDSQYCGAMVPPAFQCDYGSGVDDCRQQVQAILDTWYKDFNLLFTLTRPPSGDYYTVIITSGWTDCQKTLPPSEAGMDPANQAGIAPGNCNDNPGQTALAIECGSNAHDCATLIAHEHAHLVGLEHTDSIADVMNRRLLSTAAGFDNVDNSVINDVCDNLTQNSYQRMLSALGAWPGGTKPSPLAALPDAGEQDLPAADGGDSPSGGGSVGPTPAGSDGDGGVIAVLGVDAAALVRPTLPTVDAATPSPGKRGGCNLAGPTGSASASISILLLVLALFARQVRLTLRWSVARSRRASARRP
jgi:hypothetical protein